MNLFIVLNFYIFIALMFFNLKLSAISFYIFDYYSESYILNVIL